MKIIIALGMSLMLSGAAAAQDAAVETPGAVCPLPSLPAVERPVKPNRPPVPSCVNEARGTHTCNNRALNAYQAAGVQYQQAFNAYVAQVNSYLRKLENYTREGIAYAECERNVVLPEPLISG